MLAHRCIWDRDSAGSDGSRESSEVVTGVQEDRGDVGHVEGDRRAVRKWGILSQGETLPMVIRMSMFHMTTGKTH